MNSCWNKGGIACGSWPGSSTTRVEILNLRWQKEKTGFLREEGKMGRQIQNKTRTDHTIETQECTGSSTHKRRSTPQDVCKPGGTTIGGSSPAVSPQSASPLGRAWRGRRGCCPPRRAARTQWGRLLPLPAVPTTPAFYTSKNNFSLVHDFERL